MPEKWAELYQFCAKVSQSSKFDPQYLLPNGALGNNFSTGR